MVSLVNTIGRKFWITLTGFLEDSYRNEETAKHVSVPKSEAILVGSRCEDNTHAPVLDIDFPVQLFPSTTPGHFHLYLDKKLSWDKYKRLLEALYEAGIVQRGFYEMSLSRGQSMVLLPGKNRVELTPGYRFTT